MPRRHNGKERVSVTPDQYSLGWKRKNNSSKARLEIDWSSYDAFCWGGGGVVIGGWQWGGVVFKMAMDPC